MRLMSVTKTSPRQSIDDWNCGGWADHQHTRFEATAGSSLLERLQWLEDAALFARQLAGARKTQAPAFARNELSSLTEEQALYSRTPSTENASGSDGGQPA